MKLSVKEVDNIMTSPFSQHFQKRGFKLTVCVCATLQYLEKITLPLFDHLQNIYLRFE